MRRGSTEWMRNGSMIVLKRSGTAAPMLVRRSFLDESDCLGHAADPRLPMSGQHELRLDAFEAGEGLAGPREIRAERRELRPGLAREHVECREGVADEQRVPRRNVERGAALAVA